MDKEIEESVLKVLRLLAEERFEELETLTQGVRLKRADIAKVVAEYGRTIIAPPETLRNSIDVVEINAAVPPRWSVIVPIWTKEEGRSDLSVELTLIKTSGGLQIELDDIRVL